MFINAICPLLEHIRSICKNTIYFPHNRKIVQIFFNIMWVISFSTCFCQSSSV